MRGGVYASLLAHAVLVVWTASCYSPTRDEPAHLAAAVSHWQFGDFSLYRVNPPLVRMTAALPALLLGARTDWSEFDPNPTSRAEFRAGRRMVAANGARIVTLIFWGRIACLPFTILGAYICWRWAAELYGPLSGVLAATLWSFCPVVLGHAALMTPDVPATSLGLLACYLFWRWLKAPTWASALCAA